MAYEIQGIAGQRYNELNPDEQARVQGAGDSFYQRQAGTVQSTWSPQYQSEFLRNAQSSAREEAQRAAEGIFTSKSDAMRLAERAKETGTATIGNANTIAQIQAQGQKALQGAVPVGSAGDYLQKGIAAGTVSPTSPEQQFAASMQGNTKNIPGVNPVQPSPDINARYAAAHQQMQSSGTPAPADGGMAKSMIQGGGAIAPAPQANPVLDTLFQEDKNIGNFSKMVQDYLNPQTQQKSLREEYDALAKTKGIEGMNTELMNMKNVIEGTEDDIRTEITKTGGFATDSQVLALTNARNKTMVKNYNNLLQTKQQAEDYIKTVMGLEESDREAAQKKLDTQLNLGFKLQEMNTKMQENARSTLNNIVNQVGYDGLAQMTQGNPYYTSLVENTLGLGAGGLANLSQVANKKDLQFVSGTENQPMGYFNKSTGTFTKLAGGGGGQPSVGSSAFSNMDEVKAFQQANGLKVDGIVGPQTRAAMQKAGIVDLNGVVDTILASGKFTKDQANTIRKAITNGEDPFTVVKNNAKNIMGQTAATDLGKTENAKEQLSRIDTLMKQFYAKGGDSGFFKGNFEKTINKLGQVNNPELVDISTSIALAMQAYRLAVTGTAASVQEDVRIDAIFPGITSGEILNNTKTKTLLREFEGNIDSGYRNVLGPAYDKLKNGGSSGTLTGVNFSDVIPQITLDESKKEAYIPRSVWSTLGSRMDALLKEFKDDGYNLLING